jgi:hypothetical protein
MNMLTSLVLAGTLSVLATGPVWAGTSADEANELGGDKLTAFGAEKAGSADGAIPAYTGGLSTPPTGHAPGGPQWQNPYASEKPLYSITSKNMEQYADKLTPGTKALLTKDPTLRIDVYPSHRSMYYPDWVLENTKKDATTAKLTGEVEGDGVTGSYAGIPFPMPKNGYEAIWNTYLHFQPVYTDLRGGCYLMDSSGGLTETANVMTVTSTPYYDDKQSKLSDGYYEKYSSILYEPATQSGQKVAKFYTANFSQQDEQSWLYMPGQRRVRVAPEFKYDTPIAQVGGALFFDELYGMSGRLDRFDFALKGKKEMIVPYNDYGLASADVNSVAGTKHLNPEKVRWELHRVWVVDATLKADKRHAFSRRTFYIDEDSWTISTTESYDNNHQIERVYYTFPIFYYEKNLGGVGTQSFAVYDLLKGSYYLNNFNVGSGSNHLFVKDKILNPQQFTPVGLAGSGIS